MKRTPNALAQYAFSLSVTLRRLRHQTSFAMRALAGAANTIALPLSRRFGRGHVVTAHVYGRRLVVPAEHALPPTLAEYPQYNRPLALSAQAVADHRRGDEPLAIIDVGANVGDTIAIIEQRCPTISQYLCIEADRELAELCKSNYGLSTAVRVLQHFVGENEGTPVRLEDDGNANPSTKLADSNHQVPGDNRLVRLDTIAISFAEEQGHISLIKVDTEGYDFSILRSGRQLLERYKPGIYFEWFPRLLHGLGENPCDGFDFLGDLGYEYFVLFTNRGDYYCTLYKPERFVLESLAALTLPGNPLVYFDVFTCPDKNVCERLVQLNQQVADGSNP